MWIGEMELPVEVMQAHAEGRLVLFVGAGVSVAEPSGLPSFQGLTEEILESSGSNIRLPNHSGLEDELNRQESQVRVASHSRLDEILGELDDRSEGGKVDVHARTAAIVDRAGSNANQLHRNLVRLAEAGPSPKIVTTNYDRHLSACWSDAAEFLAPALPMGSDFEGLVYLHGSVSQDPSRLVVTDADFGRAYLTDAWAARFLAAMFQKYVILFVGYSHEDLVMSYLARGLPRDSPRYALAKQADVRHWERLGVSPISYDSHDGLPAALADWVDQLDSSVLSQRERLRQILDRSPEQLNRSEEEYLLTSLMNQDRAPVFATKAAGSISWLRWASENGALERQFTGDSPLELPGRILARWFAEFVVSDDKLAEEAWLILESRHFRIGPDVWAAVVGALTTLGGPLGENAKRWLPFLLVNMPRGAERVASELIPSCQLPEDTEAMLVLFRFLTEPYAKGRKHYGFLKGPYFEIAVRGEAHWLETAQELFVKRLPANAVDLLEVCESQLRSADRLQGLYAPSSWDDSLSRGRAAIEESHQNRGEAFDVITSVARDSLASLMAADPGSGELLLYRWLDTDVTLLKRIALHCWIARSEANADEQIAWILKNSSLDDHLLHHEVFTLLRAALPNASVESGNQLVERITSSTDPEDELSVHQSLRVLRWAQGSVPALVSAAAALDNLESQFPEFSTDPHPDFLSWVEVGSRPFPKAFPGTELQRRIGDDARAAVALLESYRDREFQWGQPTWPSALGDLARTISDNPDSGVALLMLDELSTDLFEVVVGELSGVELSDGKEEELLRILVPFAKSPEHVAPLARFLRQRSDADGAFAGRSVLAQEIARSTWSAAAPVEVDQNAEHDRWLEAARDHWAGDLVTFWMCVISAARKKRRPAWIGISQQAKESLELLVSSDGEASCFAQVVLVHHAAFLYDADDRWTTEHVLPLLDWEQDARVARRAWDGYLRNRELSVALLNERALQLYRLTMDRLSELTTEQSDLLAEHLAFMAVTEQIGIDPWIDRFLFEADLELRVTWARAVATRLADANPDELECLWNDWIGSYWSSRLDSIPTVLEREEASVMVDWISGLSSSFEEAVQCVVRFAPPVDQGGRVLRRLISSDLPDRELLHVATLLLAVMAESAPGTVSCLSIEKVVKRLAGSIPRPQLLEIADEALRLGCGQAESWLDLGDDDPDDVVGPDD